MENISLQYPIWFVGLCVVLGLLYAVVLYFRDRSYADQPLWLRTAMGLLRFLAVALLSSLLLSPLLKLRNETVQKPIIVLGQDQSTSIHDQLTAEDSANYVGAIGQLREILGNDYVFKSFGFGDEITETDNWVYDDQVTDISQFLQHVSDNYGDQNLGAVILASDGMFNRGINPLYFRGVQKAPLFTIALGDTTEKTDLLLKHVYHNKIAFLGDKFKVQVDVMASNLRDKRATITVDKYVDNRRIAQDSREIRIADNPFFTTEEFVLDANVVGVNRFRVRVSNMADEINYVNNRRDFFIEVIDSRQKVLILGNSPHPDLAAFKSLLETNENYEVDVFMADELQGNLAEYDMVVFHQLPSRTQNIAAIVARLDARKTPRLFFLGGQTSTARFNDLQETLKITGAQRAPNEVQPIVDQSFNLFTLPETLNDQLQRFAPILAPFGEYAADPAANVYLYQKIGKVDTRFPLVLFSDKNGIKTGVFAGEGLWKWKLYDFLQHENHALVETFVSKMVQYLAVKDDKRKFRVSPGKNLYLDNETITFNAELYNQSYEVINEPDIFMTVRDAEDKEFNYTFNKSGNVYAIDIGKFPVGDYRYTAYTDYTGQRLQASGRFSVQAIQLESYETTADHRLLNVLSERYGGKLFYPEDITTIATEIRDNVQIKPVIYTATRTKSIINLKWIFGILAGLLFLEWFLRRYFGGY